MSDGGDQPDPEEAARLAKLIREALSGRSAPGVTEVTRLDPERQAALDDRRQDIELKRRYAEGLFKLLLGQMAVADGVFVVYAWAGEHWQLSAGVIQIWLAATLVETVGVVTVVTRYLFPRRDAAG